MEAEDPGVWKGEDQTEEEMKPPFILEWLLVTPAMAAGWLTKNIKNRNLRETTVMAFARDMSRGAWSENHQAIAFGKAGNLIDGQHRLAAVVKSGKSIHFLVVRDMPERFEGVKADVMDTVDRGNSRSVADILKLQHGYVAHAPTVVAAATIIGAIALQDFGPVRRPSVPTIIEIIGRYKKGLQFVLENRPTTRGLRIVPVAAAIAFAHATSPRKTEQFYKQLGTGTGLTESPLLTFRNFLLNEGSIISGMGSGSGRLQLAELTLHTLWCELQNHEMSRIPKPNLRPGADWFRRQQPENVKFLESLFPLLTPVVALAGPKQWKPTAAAEALIRGRDMSERLKGRPLLTADDFR